MTAVLIVDVVVGADYGKRFIALLCTSRDTVSSENCIHTIHFPMPYFHRFSPTFFFYQNTRSSFLLAFAFFFSKTSTPITSLSSIFLPFPGSSFVYQRAILYISPSFSCCFRSKIHQQEQQHQQQRQQHQQASGCGSTAYLFGFSELFTTNAPRLPPSFLSMVCSSTFF